MNRATGTTEHMNVLASQAGWAWPVALRQLFEPRGVNLLMARDSNEFVNILSQRRIHTTIIDADATADAMGVLRIIRLQYPMVPCIVLKKQPERNLLTEVLDMDVFGVVDKPVNIDILKGLLNRLFVKRYDSLIFS